MRFGRVQLIWWFPKFLGFRVRRWRDDYNGKILDFSILILWLEIRVWKKGREK